MLSISAAGGDNPLHSPQVLALEIRIDRIEIICNIQEQDIEDMVLWVQIMDLPCFEMLPYQRDRIVDNSQESIDVVDTKSIGSIDVPKSEDGGTSRSGESSSRRMVKVKKKSPTMKASGPDLDQSASVVAFENRKLRKSIKRFPAKRNSKNFKKHSEIGENDISPISKKVTSDLKIKSSLSQEASKESDAVKPLNIKLPDGEPERQVSQQNMDLVEAHQTSNIWKEDEKSVKNIKLLTRLIAPPVEYEPIGIAFNSDCCVLIPCTSVSETLYKMERMPITIYLVRQQPCYLIEGKVVIPFDYAFQNTVVRAAKIRGGIIMHTSQENYPIYKINQNKNIGRITGCVKIMSFGQYGVTELRGPTGDLMVGNLLGYRTRMRDSRDIPEVDLERRPDTNPYGLVPVVTRNNLPPQGGYVCPSSAPLQSMFQFVQTYFKTPPADPDGMQRII